MAEFKEVMRQARRMCKETGDCGNCPMHAKKQSCTPKNHCDVRPGDDAEYERLVITWAGLHPEPVYPTWGEWQREMFPDASIAMCPKAFILIDSFNCPTGVPCHKCSNYIRIPADIAEKLGIQPV